MASRLSALLIWAAVAASLAYWGLRWLAPPTGVPHNAAAVTLDGGVRGDLRRLLAGPAKADASANQADPSLASALAARLKLLGVVAPQPGGSQGVALLSIDGKPPRAVRVGGTVDGDMVLQSLTQRGASIGPVDGPVAVSLDLPPLPPPATGALPPPTGVTRAIPASFRAPGGGQPGLPGTGAMPMEPPAAGQPAEASPEQGSSPD